MCNKSSYSILLIGCVHRFDSNETWESSILKKIILFSYPAIHLVQWKKASVILVHIFNGVILSHKQNKSWIRLWPFGHCYGSWCMHWISCWGLCTCHSSMALRCLWPCRTYSLYSHPIQGLTNLLFLWNVFFLLIQSMNGLAHMYCTALDSLQKLLILTQILAIETNLLLSLWQCAQQITWQLKTLGFKSVFPTDTDVV